MPEPERKFYLRGQALDHTCQEGRTGGGERTEEPRGARPTPKGNPSDSPHHSCPATLSSGTKKTFYSTKLKVEKNINENKWGKNIQVFLKRKLNAHAGAEAMTPHLVGSRARLKKKKKSVGGVWEPLKRYGCSMGAVSAVWRRFYV